MHSKQSSAGKGDAKINDTKSIHQHITTLIAELKAVEGDAKTTAALLHAHTNRLKIHEYLVTPNFFVEALKAELSSILIARLENADVDGFFLILKYFFSNDRGQVNGSDRSLLSYEFFQSAFLRLDDNNYVKFLDLFGHCDSTSWVSFKDYRHLSLGKLEALLDDQRLISATIDFSSLARESTSDVFLKYVELKKDVLPKLVWDAEEEKNFCSSVNTQIQGVIANLSPKALGVYLNLMTGSCERFKQFLSDNRLVEKILFSYMLNEPSWKDLPPNNEFTRGDEKRNAQEAKINLSEKIILFTRSRFLATAKDVWLQGKEMPDYLAEIIVKLFPADKHADYQEMLLYLAKKILPDHKQPDPRIVLFITTSKNQKIDIAYSQLPEYVLRKLWSEGLKTDTDLHQLQAHILENQDSRAEAMLSALIEMNDAKNETIAGCDVAYSEYKAAISKATDACLDINTDSQDEKRTSMEQQYQQAYVELNNSIKTNLLCIKIIAEIKNENRWGEFISQLEDYDARHFQTRINQAPPLPVMKYRFLDKASKPYEEHTAVHDQKSRSKVQAHKKGPASHAPKTPATAIVNLSNTTFGETDPTRQVGVFFRGPTDAQDLMQQMADSKAHRPHPAIQVVVKLLSRRDIGTVYRWWVNSKEVLYKHLQRFDHSIYAARDYDKYLKAIAENVNQTNEILIKPSRESMIGIPVLTITTDTLALARQRFLDVYKKSKRILPIVHYDRFNRRVSLIPLQRLFSMKLVIAPDKSVHAIAPSMEARQFDVLWVMLFSTLSNVEHIPDAPPYEGLSITYRKQHSALEELNKYCIKNIVRDEKFVQTMRSSNFTKYYQFYTQYDDYNSKENPVLSHRANINNLEFAMIMISLKKIKHARYTMDNQSIDTMPVGDFMKKIWNEDKHVCDEKGAVLSNEELQALFKKRNDIILTPLKIIAVRQYKPKALALLRKNMPWEILNELHSNAVLSMIDHLQQQIYSGIDALSMVKKMGDLHQFWYRNKSTPTLLGFPAYMYFEEPDLYHINYTISTAATNTNVNLLSTSGSELLQHFFNEGVMECDAKEAINGCVENFNVTFRILITSLLSVRATIPAAVNYLSAKPIPFSKKDLNAFCELLDVSKVLTLNDEFHKGKPSFSRPMFLYFDQKCNTVAAAILCTLKPELINLQRFINTPDSKKSVDNKLLAMPLNRIMDMLWKENGVRSDAKSALVPFKEAVEIYALKKLPVSNLLDLLFVLEYLQMTGDPNGTVKEMRLNSDGGNIIRKGNIYNLAILIELNEQAKQAAQMPGHPPYAPFITTEEDTNKRKLDFEVASDDAKKRFPVAHFFHSWTLNTSIAYFVKTGKHSYLDLWRIKHDEFLEKLWKEGFKEYICKNADVDKSHRSLQISIIDELKQGLFKNYVQLINDLQQYDTSECKLFREHISSARLITIYNDCKKYSAILRKATENSSLRFFSRSTNTLQELKPLLAMMDIEKIPSRQIEHLMSVHRILFTAIRNPRDSTFRNTQTQNFYIDLYENLFGVRITDKDSKQKAGPGPGDPATAAPKAP